MASKKLFDLMLNEPTLDRIVNRQLGDEVTDPAPVSHGMDVPELDEGIRALLIMSGAVAKYVINYWLVVSKTTGARCHVAGKADFEGWRQALDELGQRSNGQRYK